MKEAHSKKLFVKVRDLPFEVIPGTSLDYQKAIESIEKYGRGSCTSKHFYLGKLYEEIGLDVSYVTYTFYWEEQKFLSERLKQLSRNLPEQYHLALKVEGRVIDATFDKLLTPIFPVNEFEDCKISVECKDEIVHSSPWERIEYVKLKAKKSNKLQKFYSELNEYAKRIRKLNKLKHLRSFNSNS